MLVRVWQYDVRPGREAEFERLYGASGAWAQLFARSAGYLGTELFRAVQRPGRHVTVDRFSDDEAWHHFLGEHRTAYTELDSPLRRAHQRGSRPTRLSLLRLRPPEAHASRRGRGQRHERASR